MPYEGEALKIEYQQCDKCGQELAVFIRWTNDEGGHEYWETYCDKCDISEGDVL